MSAGELGSAMAGGQESMDKVAAHSENAKDHLKTLGGRILAFAAMIEDVEQGLLSFERSDEATSAMDSSRVAEEEAKSTHEIISPMAQGSNNPNAHCPVFYKPLPKPRLLPNKILEQL